MRGEKKTTFLFAYKMISSLLQWKRFKIDHLIYINKMKYNLSKSDMKHTFKRKKKLQACLTVLSR